MKTISLKAVQNGLSRDEMRAVKGGCGIGGSCKTSCAQCNSNSECCSGVCSGDQPGCGGGNRCLR